MDEKTLEIALGTAEDIKAAALEWAAQAPNRTPRTFVERALSVTLTLPATPYRSVLSGLLEIMLAL